jgi:hypothetical protein
MAISYTAHGLPKPNASELISSGWDAISDLADAVEAAALDDGAWTTIALGASWVAYGGIYPAPAYRRFRGVVFLRGLMKSGTQGPNVAFTLPAGYRPGSIITPAVGYNWAGAGQLDIGTDGTARVYSPGNVAVSLDTVRFIAEG